MVVKRNTWQREAVREALGTTEGFVSAQTLHAHLREAGSSVGLATVYRALADLATEGDADRVATGIATERSGCSGCFTSRA